MRTLLLSLFLLTWAACAQAATELVAIAHLPLDEAADAVKSQLSPHGSVVSVPSRNMLLIQDDEAAIQRARELLSRLDQPLQQYRTTVEVVRRQQLSQRGLSVSAVLPGGWVRVVATDEEMRSSSRSTYQLAVQANRPGHIEAGEIVPVESWVRGWLAGYGIQPTVSYVPVTGGFDVLVMPAAGNRARVRIMPWLRRMQPGSERIDVAAADTELEVRLGEEVVIAAASQEAATMARALLLSAQSQSGRQQLLIRLRIDSLP